MIGKEDLCLSKIRKDLGWNELYCSPNSLLQCPLPARTLITLGSILRSRLDLQLEILARRHQIGVLERSVHKRPRLTSTDSLLWVSLSRFWRHWRSTLPFQLQNMRKPLRCQATTVSGLTMRTVPSPHEYRLRFYHTHTGERLDVVYRRGDQYIPEALDELDYYLRDHRTGMSAISILASSSFSTTTASLSARRFDA